MYKKNRLVYGVGINDSDEPTQKKNPRWACPYYRKWKHMLERCYSEKHIVRQPTYIGCSVSDGWLLFSNFRQWMIEQEEFHGSLADLHLDKDIIDPTNKIYGPDKCAFVSRQINNFVTDCNASRGEYPLGVGVRGGRYISRCRDPFKNRLIRFGSFDTPEEAHRAWREQKHVFACQLAVTVKDCRVKLALRNRYNATN